MKHSLSFDRFPGGKKHAVTLSYDDGNIADRRLISILNEYGLKGTFCLNSSTLGKEGFVTPEELPSLYAGHEIAAHSVHHKRMTELEPEEMAQEVLEDRKALESYAGAIVDGFSYPYGANDETLRFALRSCGIRYARTTVATHGFRAPDDLLQWNPTCRHRDELDKYTIRFLRRAEAEEGLIFFLWGHSYEFDRDDNWEVMEHFCNAIGGRGDTWYCTNGELASYLTARRMLRISADGSIIENPTALGQWFTADGETVYLEPGGMMTL